MGTRLLPHVIIEEKGEVWFVGSRTLAIGLNAYVSKYFPGYTGHLASKDYFYELQEQYGKD